MFRFPFKTALALLAGLSLALFLYLRPGNGIPAPAFGIAAAEAAQQARVAVIGDSLVSGYKMTKEQAYPARLEALLREHDYNITVDNFGMNGDTLAGGARRIKNIPVEEYDVIIIILGGNDMLRTVSPAVSRKGLDTILQNIRGRHPPVEIVIGGMKAYPHLPAQYRVPFERLFPEVSQAHAAWFYPFILHGIYDEQELMMDDAIHPNPAGAAEMARRTAPTVAKAVNRKFSR